MRTHVMVLSLCLALVCFLCAMMGSDVKELNNRVTELERIVQEYDK
jgi:hypothetical protein